MQTETTCGTQYHFDKGRQSVLDEQVYEGWRNRETWGVVLDKNNTKERQDGTLYMARGFLESSKPTEVLTAQENATYRFSDWMMNDLESCAEKLSEDDLHPVFAALLETAIGRVDWDSIARHFIEMALAQESVKGN